ncbi:1-propanol dehydrogenase PduQ [Massilioclostridium coli]|uniref:1-propanol dehydrogenase PduQ n=1 Tax=Massilioclostridium coli TaxID=1870991 RepID=UPI00085C6E91|nr:1-propanol dehydrogenase PduQ [Massilioclostridium coli]
MSSFAVKTKVFSGVDAFEYLKGYPIQNVYIITDPFAASSGMIKNLTDVLDQMGAKYTVFSDVVADPPMNVIIDGIAQAMEVKPDSIMAMGGGSAIDTAKAISYFYMKIAQVPKPFCVAIPTTSGTGSEVTAFAVVSDKEKNVKYPLVDDIMLPDVAILNPKLTLSVPPTVTADTGMDVLTHAIEAYVSTGATDFSDTLAEKAVQIIFKYLPMAYDNGNDIHAREKLHNASCMAGMAFNNANLGINHSIAHAIGAKFHVPHGRANAIILPYIIAFNAGMRVISKEDCSYAMRKYAKLAHLMGVGAGSNRQSVKNFIQLVEGLIDALGIPVSLRDQDINEDDYKGFRNIIAENAMADACTPSNPRVPTTHQIRELLDMCYYHTAL